eukprot:364833-Chlamydomonas_euryale.AAC.4
MRTLPPTPSLRGGESFMFDGFFQGGNEHRRRQAQRAREKSTCESERGAAAPRTARSLARVRARANAVHRRAVLNSQRRSLVGA